MDSKFFIRTGKYPTASRCEAAVDEEAADEGYN